MTLGIGDFDKILRKFSHVAWSPSDIFYTFTLERIRSQEKTKKREINFFRRVFSLNDAWNSHPKTKQFFEFFRPTEAQAKKFVIPFENSQEWKNKLSSFFSSNDTWNSHALSKKFFEFSDDWSPSGIFYT